MRRRSRPGSLVGIALPVCLALLVSACTGGGSSATAAPTSGGGVGGGGQGSGADAGTLDACDFLTVDDIKTVVGWAVSPGVLQNSDGQTDCEWAGPDEKGSVGLTIANFDEDIWEAGSGAGDSKPVAGIGEAAFSGWPHKGDLAVKYKGYLVEVAIIDFSKADVDSETVTLANEVLPKL